MTTTNQPNQKEKKFFSILACTLLLFAFIVFPSRGSASPKVSGKYLSVSGKKIILGLTIKSPAPSNLIVEQFLAPGNKIGRTAPPAKKINSRTGKIKWLFRNTSPGNLTIMTFLNAPVKGTVSSIVRYRDPATGKYIEQRIN